MAAALGAAPRKTTATMGPAPAMMKTTARMWSAALVVHRASTAPLRAEAPPVVAVISLRSATPAWREVAGPPATMPRFNTRRSPPELRRQFESLPRAGVRRVAPVLFFSPFPAQRDSSVGPRWGVLGLLLLIIVLLPLFRYCAFVPHAYAQKLLSSGEGSCRDLFFPRPRPR